MKNTKIERKALMSAFIVLKDASEKFEADLRQVSVDLFSAKIREPFENDIAKKMRDLAVFTSKLRLLRAKQLSLTTELSEEVRQPEIVLRRYEEQATCKILEQKVTKTLVHEHAVKELITTPDDVLEPVFLERKEKIIEALSQYTNAESQLLEIEALRKEKENQLAAVRERWEAVVGAMRDMRADSSREEDEQNLGPRNQTLEVLVQKLELMRWLLSKLLVTRTKGYDWHRDPHRRIQTLKLAREVNTVDNFTEA